VRQDQKLIEPEDLKIIWLRDINQLGRRYVGGWVRRGLNMLDFSSNELDSFLHLLKLSGPCNFAKRDIIYDNLSLMSPESIGGSIMNRKRFNLIVIVWHYLNQSYYRRIDKTAYDQLGPHYQIERKIIRRFEGYYKLNLKVKNLEI
jgi:hypothetical protein